MFAPRLARAGDPALRLRTWIPLESVAQNSIEHTEKNKEDSRPLPASALPVPLRTQHDGLAVGAGVFKDGGFAPRVVVGFHVTGERGHPSQSGLKKERRDLTAYYR